MRSVSLLALALLAGTAACTPSEAPPSNGSSPARTVELSVTEKGFEPSPVKVRKGEPLKLVVTRKTDRTCATSLVVPGYGIEKELPLGQPVEVTLTPKESGELKYGCQMDLMIAGVLMVE